jgi:hypothetical protein
LGNSEKVEGFKRLERFVRGVEQNFQPTADFAKTVAHEHAISASLDGRTVLDGRKRPRNAPRQGELFGA